MVFDSIFGSLFFIFGFCRFNVFNGLFFRLLDKFLHFFVEFLCHLFNSLLSFCVIFPVDFFGGLVAERIFKSRFSFFFSLLFLNGKITHKVSNGFFGIFSEFFFNFLDLCAFYFITVMFFGFVNNRCYYLSDKGICESFCDLRYIVLFFACFSLFNGIFNLLFNAFGNCSVNFISENAF